MNRSSTLFNEAKNYIPGGVNSPVRAFKGVGGDPIYFKRGEGAYLYDVDGNAYIDYVGGMFGLFFSSEEKVTNFSQASNCDIELFKKFYKSMIRQGVYLAPSAYECGFLSAAHTKNELDQTINAALTAFSEL